MSAPSVIVIDDDPGVLESLVSMLTVGGLRVTGFPSAMAFLDEIAELRMSCIVTDIRLPRIDGLTLIQRLKDRGLGHIPVIVISGHADVPVAVSAMQLGATTVLEKPFAPQRLLDAIAQTQDATGDSPLSEEQQAIRQRYGTLTLREREVLTHLIEGSSSKVAAKRLGISPRTVDVFRASILKKMQAPNIAGLATLAARAGL